MNTTQTIDGEIYFTNLPNLIVNDFHPAEGPGAGWFPFHIGLDGFDSVGLATGAFSPAGELVLDLGLKGWHRLFIAHNPVVRVWLDGETGYCQMPGDTSSVRDHPLPAADFTNRKLHIAPVRGSERNESVQVFYLRAEPLDGPPDGNRNLIVTNDGHGVFCAGMDEPHDIYRHVYPYREGDFFRMLWGVYGGAMLTMRPDTRVGESPLRSDAGCMRAGDFCFNRSLRRFTQAGVDPLSVVRDATRACGLELHYYIRMSAFYGPYPHMEWTTRFFQQHPQWHCRDEHGRSVRFISYAYPQVQDHVLAFYDELLDYEPDGICLAFNRGLPLMICEEPVMQAYERKHGRRPTLPEEVDSPELRAVRHELLAEFVERAAAIVQKRGKVLSCIVPRDFDRNHLFGLDADLLVQRGLVESVLVGAGHGDDPALNRDVSPLQSLKALGNTAGVKVYGGGSNAVHGMGWVNGDLPARARFMGQLLDARLDGGWFWDADNVIGMEWEAMRRFGSHDKVRQIAEGDWPPDRTRQTRSIHDLIVSRYNPHHAY